MHKKRREGIQDDIQRAWKKYRFDSFQNYARELKVAQKLKGTRSSHRLWPRKAQPFQSRRQSLKAKNHRNDPERAMHNLQSDFKFTSPSPLIL